MTEYYTTVTFLKRVPDTFSFTRHTRPMTQSYPSFPNTVSLLLRRKGYLTPFPLTLSDTLSPHPFRSVPAGDLSGTCLGTRHQSVRIVDLDLTVWPTVFVNDLELPFRGFVHRLGQP